MEPSRRCHRLLAQCHARRGVNVLHRFRSFTNALLRRNRFEDAMADEMREHLDMRVEDLVTAGTPRSEAERRAGMEFGSIDGAKDDCRQARGVSFIDALRQDFRYALRVLRRSPGFALLCIGIMAVGIGANTAVFSVVNAVLLKPLPYREPRRIVTLSNVVKTPVALNALAKLISVPDFQDWHDQSTVFDAMAYYGTRRVSVTVGTSAEYARLTRVTREFFRVFDVQPVAGRPFTTDEEKVGAGAVLISSVYARRHFEPLSLKGLWATSLRNAAASSQGHVSPYSARRTFTGSSRKARYAGTRLAINATRASVAPTAASVTGSDALTPKTSVLMTFADASAAIVPAATPTSAGDMPSTITRRRTSDVRAPSAVLIPISRLRPRTMYESTL